MYRYDCSRCWENGWCEKRDVVYDGECPVTNKRWFSASSIFLVVIVAFLIVLVRAASGAYVPMSDESHQWYVWQCKRVLMKGPQYE